MENGELHVHAPQPTAKRIISTTCPDCKKQTHMLSFFTPWYGWQDTCLNCGRTWADGEWLDLTFEPKSRQKSIDRAKSRWRKLPPVANNHYGMEDIAGRE